MWESVSSHLDRCIIGNNLLTNIHSTYLTWSVSNFYTQKLTLTFPIMSLVIHFKNHIVPHFFSTQSITVVFGQIQEIFTLSGLYYIGLCIQMFPSSVQLISNNI